MNLRSTNWILIILIFAVVCLCAFGVLYLWVIHSVLGPPKLIDQYVMQAGESELVIPYSQYSHPFLVLEAQLPGTDEERASAYFADHGNWFHLVAENDGEIVTSETLRLERTFGLGPPNLSYRIHLPPYHDIKAGDVDELRISVTEDAPTTLPRPINMRLYYTH